MNYDLAALSEFISGYIAKKDLPGVSVCVNTPSGTLFRSAYGFQDLAHTRPVDSDTIFGIASMSKSITCLAALILEHEGKLSLGDPVSRWLPGFRIPGAPRDSVLVRHLGEHTTGIPPLPILEWSLALNTPPEAHNSAYYDKIAAVAENRMATLDDMLSYLANPAHYEPLGAPGEIMSYSNECFGLLSYIVDVASGESFEDFVQKRIFDPIGMKRTTYDNRRLRALGNVTNVFSRRDDTLYDSAIYDEAPPYRGYGAVKSTASDMAAYYETLANRGVLRDKRILSEEVVERMIGARYGEMPEGVYCQGLYKRTFGGAVICEHGGALTGVSSKGGFLKDQGISSVVLCNVGSADVYPIQNAIYNLLLDLPLDTHHSPYAPCGAVPEDLSYFEGDFRCNEEYDARWHVFAEQGKLFAERDGERVELLWCRETMFLAPGKTQTDPRDGQTVRFFVRNGRSWAAKIGSRVYQRV